MRPLALFAADGAAGLTEAAAVSSGNADAIAVSSVCALIAAIVTAFAWMHAQTETARLAKEQAIEVTRLETAANVKIAKINAKASSPPLPTLPPQRSNPASNDTSLSTDPGPETAQRPERP